MRCPQMRTPPNYDIRRYGSCWRSPICCSFAPKLPQGTPAQAIARPRPRIEPLHVAAYIEALGKDFEKPTVKQHLSAIRMLFDWLVTGQVVATNPAHSVRGPKHVVKTGKTTVLTGEQARQHRYFNRGRLARSRADFGDDVRLPDLRATLVPSNRTSRFCAFRPFTAASTMQSRQTDAVSGPARSLR